MKQYSPLHLIPKELSIRDEDLISCAEKNGTPCYVYDLKLVRNRWRELSGILPDCGKLCYSVKANPNSQVIEALSKIGSDFEVASVGELAKTLKQGVKPEQIYYIAPGKSKKDIRRAISVGVKAIVVDSPSELEKIINASDQLKVAQPVMFRLNTGKKSKGSLSMAGMTQFGMTKKDVVNCWKSIFRDARKRVECIGLHCFQGTNIFDPKQIAEEIRHILHDFSDIAKEVGNVPQYIDLGGGFGSPKFHGDKPIDLNELRNELTSVFENYSSQFLDSTYLFESGRYIVGEAGVFLSRVRDLKDLFGIKYAILDGGINCYGGFEKTIAFRPAPIRVLSNDRPLEKVTLCGPSCTPMDILAHNVELSSVRVGDLIAFYNAGAYNFSASPGRFLSLGYPIEVCL